MNGLELARGYFEVFGRAMLENEFSDLLPLLAVGAVGSGSDRYGFDDEISRDHDFEPGFCIFLPGEDIVSRRQEFLLERAYAKLPKTFLGVSRQPLSPVGGNRNGVFRTSEFYRRAAGSPDGQLSAEQWLTLPDHALAEAVNGEVFFDNYGQFSEIRERLSRMPEDIRKKRLAGNLLLMAQSGQYNFRRCLAHGEPEAAQLALHEFVQAALRTAFLLENRYLPYYKWSFRALRALDGGAALAEKLSFLLSGGTDAASAARKSDCIEEISADCIAILREHHLSTLDSMDLERHAYAVNDCIADGTVRNLHILAGCP